VREHGQGDVPVPGVVTADLIVIEAGLGLGGLEALLNRPPLIPMKRKWSLAWHPVPRAPACSVIVRLCPKDL
jgi:hypothetical protein